MTKEEIVKELRKVLNAVDITFPYRHELINAIELLKPSLPSNLDEAARRYAIPLYMKDIDESHFDEYPYSKESETAFKAGAEWQKEHDHDFCLTCEKNLDVVFHKGMQYAIEQMKKDAIELPVKIDAGGYPYIQITGIEFFDYEKDKPTAKEGDVIKIIIIHEDENN